MLSGLVPIFVPIVLAAAPVQAPVQAATVTGAECASYLYRGTNVSLCDRFAGRRSVNCPEVGHPVTVTGPDGWGLDRDKDKVACEDQAGYTPVPPSKSASTSPSPTRSSARPSVSASTSPSKSTSPAPSRSASTPPAGPQLPVTGPALPALLIVGGGAFATGVGVLALLAARRRNRFEA